MAQMNGYDLLKAISSGLTPEQITLSGLQGIIAAQITMKRHELHMNQKAFADFMGVSQGLVSRWEKGECNFTLESLVHIASKLDIDIQCPFKLPAPPLYYTPEDKIVDISNRVNPYASSSYSEPKDYDAIEAL